MNTLLCFSPPLLNPDYTQQLNYCISKCIQFCSQAKSLSPAGLKPEVKGLGGFYSKAPSKQIAYKSTIEKAPKRQLATKVTHMYASCTGGLRTHFATIHIHWRSGKLDIRNSLSPDLQTPLSIFAVRNCSVHRNGLHFQSIASGIWQRVSEAYLVVLSEELNLCSIHSKHVC